TRLKCDCSSDVCATDLAGCAQHLLFPFPFCHTIPSSYLHPADLKQMGPPLCAVVLPKVFLARVAIVLALRGFQALGSVKLLETIVLLWRYINKIELN